MKLHVALVMAAVTVSGLAACTDLSPIQSELKDLHNEVNRLSAQQGALKSSLDTAVQSSRQAADAASRASSKADQALALAQANQKSIEATNEKLDRMFRRHLSK